MVLSSAIAMLDKIEDTADFYLMASPPQHCLWAYVKACCDIEDGTIRSIKNSDGITGKRLQKALLDQPCLKNPQ